MGYDLSPAGINSVLSPAEHEHDVLQEAGFFPGDDADLLPQQKLWRAVVLRAFADAFNGPLYGNTTQDGERKVREEARRWLTWNTDPYREDRELVCDFANAHEEGLRQLSKRLLKLIRGGEGMSVEATTKAIDVAEEQRFFYHRVAKEARERLALRIEAEKEEQVTATPSDQLHGRGGRNGSRCRRSNVGDTGRRGVKTKKCCVTVRDIGHGDHTNVY